MDASEQRYGEHLMARKPILRIVRSLARSGGTLIGKCIGCMDHVNLISEIHPADLVTTSPMMQAQKWFGLVNAKDIGHWKIRPPSVLQFISMCESRARARGDTLVLRDWSHLDYIGVPFTKPGYRFALRDELESVFDIRFTTTVRHPIDQYMSLMQLPMIQKKLRFEKYLTGCHEFAKFANKYGFYRYEDFTKDPDSILRSICKDIEVHFDANYNTNWQSYTTITGDTNPSLGRGASKKAIQFFERKPIDTALLEAFRNNDEYQQTCKLLGYDA